MAQSHCLRHQERPATNRCKSCLKPICDECTYTTPEGKFCGDQCHQNDISSAEKMARLKADEAALAAEQRRAAIIKTVVMLALIAGVYFGWPHFPASIRTPVEKLIRTVRGQPEPPPPKPAKPAAKPSKPAKPNKKK
jgi:hypothetical protein